MVAIPPGPEVLLQPTAVPYFSQPVPKQLLLVHLCAPSPQQTAWLNSWRAYAAAWDYGILEADAVEPPGADPFEAIALASVAQASLSAGRCQEAEDVVRWGLLAHYGGVAIDASSWPPEHHGALADFAALTPLRGLVVLAGEKPHNTLRAPEVSGLAVSSSLVLASPRHPVVQALAQTLPANVAAVRADDPAADRAYTTGAVLLTRMLSGSFTVLPQSFTATFGVRRVP